MSKSGFSTLNRWLGRKNKDKSLVNGKLSKSSTNLSISSTNINETSQLEYNRITPLPAATTNAPFEQTFRITVLLPKDQLYVTRLGARVPLSKLLELVCDNKLLDAEKYEFRNPVDPSQVYSCDLTIGAVGLCEIRLCLKTESYDTFNSDEIIKLHRTSLIRESLSSSEFSSRNSKHTMKTTSPYSSTNSLNSVDSSALSYGRTPKIPLSSQPKVAAPPRKKRAAPRPPSQKAIPEKSPLIMENGHEEGEQKTSAQTALAAKDFSISTPNLSSSTLVNSDINGNDCNGHVEDFNELSSGNGSLNSNGYTEDTVLYAQIQKKNALNLNGQCKLEVKETNGHLPEPSPRKRIIQIKKKSTAPPAPPPRNSLYQEDAVSIASTNISSLSTPTTPVVNSKSFDSFLDQKPENSEILENEAKQTNGSLPTPLPRLTTSTTLLNATDIEQDLRKFETATEATKAKPNISKVLLNRTTTPEPRSLSCEPPEIEHCYEAQLEHFKEQKNDDDSVSKQADSGIGEPVPSPIPDSLTSAINNLDAKSNFESSSDDDDMVKVYNFKLGKTLVKPVSETKTLEELTVMNNGQEETDSEISTSLTLTPLMPNTSALTETSSWNFSIPISPPPHFADSKFMEGLEAEANPDTPITPKIIKRPVLNFEDLKQEQEQQQLKDAKEKQQEKPLRTPTTPLDNIVDELSAIIQDKGLDSLIKKTENTQEIESAKPNTLSNFSINSIQQNNTAKPKEILSEKCSTETERDKTNSSVRCSINPEEALSNQPSVPNLESSLKECTERSYTEPDFVKSSSPLSSPSSTPDEEKLYRKRSSVSSLKQRRSITRSDSFHTTAVHKESLGLNKRTSSQLSLDQMVGHLNRRRSSSELSIGESPSLQSLEVIKTILNSRKNSPSTSSEEEERNIEVNARRPSKELKFASLELKTTRTVEESENKLDKENQDILKKELITANEDKKEKPRELPKVYRYSGPPSINFSTWNERPKSQVAIKNEGDYIFGGAKAPVQNKIYRVSTPSQTTSEPPPIASKPAIIQRMGIPEQDYKVPVLVRPIQDVIVDSVPQKEQLRKVETSNKISLLNGDNSTIHQSQNCSQKSTWETFSSTNTSLHPASRPTVESVLRPQTQTIVNTCSLPRSNKQRFSTPAYANKAQIVRSSSISQQNDTERTFTNLGPQILRSSSTQKKQETERSSTPNKEAPQAPFGQNTLRRTGLKEKILAKEEKEQHKVNNVPNSTTTPSSPIQPKLVPNGDLKFNNQKLNKYSNHPNTITSAKLHLNLTNTSTSTVTMLTSNQNPQTASPTYSSSMFTAAFTPKPLTPKTATVLTTYNTFSVKSGSPNQPPPPPPTMRLKPLTPAGTPTSPTDPRDELLTAIRTFKKEGLKKA